MGGGFYGICHYVHCSFCCAFVFVLILVFAVLIFVQMGTFLLRGEKGRERQDKKHLK